MKIRYYLRGLGLGILFTAVFFLIGGDSKQTMSDEMIKERAKELGMIENTVLADIGNTGETESVVEESISEMESETESVSEEETTPETVMEETTETESVEETVETVVEETTEVESEEESVAESVAKESTVEESEEVSSQTEETEKPSDGQIFSIMVNKGEGSDTVSQRLYEAGLVDDPYAYDKYLMQNGYDRRIGAGEHLIPAGSSWQEIAQILCS